MITPWQFRVIVTVVYFKIRLVLLSEQQYPLGKKRNTVYIMERSRIMYIRTSYPLILITIIFHKIPSKIIFTETYKLVAINYQRRFFTNVQLVYTLNIVNLIEVHRESDTFNPTRSRIESRVSMHRERLLKRFMVSKLDLRELPINTVRCDAAKGRWG